MSISSDPLHEFRYWKAEREKLACKVVTIPFKLGIFLLQIYYFFFQDLKLIAKKRNLLRANFASDESVEHSQQVHH